MNERESSVRIRSDSTSSSVRAMPFFPPHLPPFIDQEGSHLGINFLPTESNYLGYTFLYYIHQRARTREEPVRMRYAPVALGDGFLHDNVIEDFLINFSSRGNKWNPIDQLFALKQEANEKSGITYAARKVFTISVAQVIK